VERRSAHVRRAGGETPPSRVSKEKKRKKGKDGVLTTSKGRFTLLEGKGGGVDIGAATRHCLGRRP